MATVSATAPKVLPGRPPGPKGRFLLGSLVEVSRDWLGFYQRCAEEYGDIVCIHLSHVPVYLLVHPRDIETVLVTNAGNFTKSADYRALARILGQGLLTSEGEFWKRQRSLIQPAFHRQNILAYAAVMTQATGRMLDSWKEKGERNIHEDLMRVTLRHDLQRHTHQVLMNIPLALFLPRIQHAAGGLGHHRRVSQDVLAVKGGLDEAALTLPEFSLAGQQALAEDTRQRPVIRGLREISRVCHQHGFYVAGMHQQIYRNMGQMDANDVPVFLGTTLIKSKPVA